MLIFDQFLTRDLAEKFAAFAGRKYGKRAIVCDSQGEADKHDLFPFVLQPPIVLVERDDIGGSIETAIENKAAYYGGRFAGT